MRNHTIGILLLMALPAVAHAQAAGGQAYYTDAQAVRGEALFKKHCAACHFAEPDPQKAKLETAGYVLAKTKTVSNLGGKYISNMQVPNVGVQEEIRGRRIYTNVYYLYRELESMPPRTDSISPQVRTDIMAYLLRQNRYPAGREELKFDLAAMKLMPLDEPGFVPLFNGKDLTGWKFLIGVGCAPPPQGCARTAPGDVYVVRNGLLLFTGKEHGLAYTERTYKDFTLRFDYLGEVPSDWDGEDVYYYSNGGYQLFVMEENLFVFPRALTLRGEQRELLAPIMGAGTGMSAKAKAFTFNADAMKRAVRPLGQWNSVQIVSKGGDVKAWVNDTLITTITQHEFTKPGHIGIQGQGFPFRWRNMRIREE